MMARLLHGGLARAAARFGDRAAVHFGDEYLTFAELDARGVAFAQHLASRGVAPGQRVAMMLTNRPEFGIAAYGISRAGAAAVLLSPAWKAFEVDHAVALTAPTFAIADGAATELLRDRFGAERTLDLDDAAALEA